MMSKRLSQSLTTFYMTVSTNTIDTTQVLRIAQTLVNRGAVRLHWNDQLPTVNFRDVAGTKRRCGVASKNNNFADLVSAMFGSKGNYYNDFSCSLTGVLAIAAALVTEERISLSAIQANGGAAAYYFAPFFNENDLALAEVAYYPWVTLEEVDAEGVAASYYQRRVRSNVQEQSKSQTAYRHLTSCIIQNMLNNDGTFVPSREDFRSAHKTLNV